MDSANTTDTITNSETNANIPKTTFSSCDDGSLVPSDDEGELGDCTTADVGKGQVELVYTDQSKLDPKKKMAYILMCAGAETGKDKNYSLLCEYPYSCFFYRVNQEGGMAKVCSQRLKICIRGRSADAIQPQRSM